MNNEERARIWEEGRLAGEDFFERCQRAWRTAVDNDRMQYPLEKPPVNPYKAEKCLAAKLWEGNHNAIS